MTCAWQETLISVGIRQVSREEQSAVVDMLVTLFLAVLLMIAGTGKAAVSDLQVNGKVHFRNMRKQLHHQVKAISTS